VLGSSGDEGSPADVAKDASLLVVLLVALDVVGADVDGASTSVKEADGGVLEISAEH
jgi:hypothetical protein